MENWNKCTHLKGVITHSLDKVLRNDMIVIHSSLHLYSWCIVIYYTYSSSDCTSRVYDRVCV